MTFVSGFLDLFGITCWNSIVFNKKGQLLENVVYNRILSVWLIFSVPFLSLF
jgi:D-methionine transport system permease protein